MSVFEKIKQGLEEAVAYENEVYEKLREAEREAESTTKRLTHEEVMEAAWSRIRAAEHADITTRDTMTTSQFDAMMEEGLKQAKAGQGMDLEEAFASINK